MTTLCKTLVLGAALSLLASTAITAQRVEEEDLPLDELTEPEAWEAIQSDFDLAVETFSSPQQEQSIGFFTGLISSLEALEVGTEEEAFRREHLLAESLSYRARASFNFGGTAQTQQDLEKLLRLQPEYDVDRSVASAGLIELFDRLKDRMVGYLEVFTDPPDATVTLDGEPMGRAMSMVSILAGDHSVLVERPGFAAVVNNVEVKAGKTKTLELALERTSAVIVVRTWPRGVRVLVNGVERGKTEAPVDDDFIPSGDAALKPREELGQLVIGGLELGPHTVEVQKAGYRAFAGRTELSELRDYPFSPLVLEAQAGTVVLKDLPDGALVQASGRLVQPTRHGDRPPELVLAPGEYRLSVTLGTLGVFETSVSVVDGENHPVSVDLRPGLVLLAVLGGDSVGGTKLKDGLRRELDRLGHWTLLDRTADGPELLAGYGIDKDRMRQMGQQHRQFSGEIDWRGVQSAADARTPGAVYMLAVLSDDLVASHADLWILPAAPGPGRPDLRRVGVDDQAAMAQLAAAFSPSLSSPRHSLGALLIDSEAAAGPVVAAVRPGGPAAAAGLQANDEVTAFASAPVLTVTQLEAQVRDHPLGEAAVVEVTRAGRPLRLSLKLESLAEVVDLADPSWIHSTLSAEVAREFSRQQGRIPRWILQLNQAAVLLQSGAYEDAVRTLRQIKAPEGPGLGQAAVNYWLGIALAQSGAQYADRAREAFGEAATAPDGRIFHDDGPWVAPRARARLTNLGSSAER